MNTALIFPGQGSQYVGMGKSLAENFSESREVYERVDDALNESFSKLIWEGPEDLLRKTENTQPALMATSMAAIAAAKSLGFNFDQVSHVAGHSLGEYSALCSVGGISLEDSAKILRKRGKAMQEATPEGEGAMAAIIGIGIKEVDKVLSEISMAGVCEIANDNEPKQVVISGTRDKVCLCMDLLKEAGAKRTILLPVSAPFHCSLMQSAAEIMKQEILGLTVNNLNIPIVANISAKEISSEKDIKHSLVSQITSRVRWTESITYLSKNNVVNFIEFGAGRVLSGLVKRIYPTSKTLNISEYQDLEKLEENQGV